ncbi:MAG: AtpZ/AtpI family protein [Thermodesulfobacteriota bacterium]
MQKETKFMLKELAYYSSLGISVALAIFIGLFIGLGLDKLFDTTPVFMFIFLGFGIAAGFGNLMKAMKKSRKL